VISTGMSYILLLCCKDNSKRMSLWSTEAAG